MIAYSLCSFSWANFVQLGEEIPFERGHQIEVPQSLFFPAISYSSVRTVADRHRLAAYRTSPADGLSGGTNIDDLERPWTPKIGVFVICSRFQAATHISRVNCAEVTIEIDQDNMHIKFWVLNVYFISVARLGEKAPIGLLLAAVGTLKFGLAPCL